MSIDDLSSDISYAGGMPEQTQERCRKGTRKSSGRTGTAVGRNEWQRAENWTKTGMVGGRGEDHTDDQKSRDMERMCSHRGSGREVTARYDSVEHCEGTKE